MSLLRSIALVFFTVGCFVVLPAQEEYDFIKFTTSEGLPSNFIAHVYADPDGFVWVSTARGLARFNGQQFVPVNELLPGVSLPTAPTRLMVKDQRGKLWLQYGRRGVYALDLAQQRLEHYDDDFFKIETPQLPGLHLDKRGNVWVLAKNGLACHRPDRPQFEWFAAPPHLIKSDFPTFTFCPSADDNLWVMAGDSVLHFDVQTHAWTFHTEIAGEGEYPYMTLDPDGSLWINRWYQKRGGLIHYDPQQKRVLGVFSENNHPDSLPSTDFQDVYVENERVWLATNDEGLVCYDKKTRTFRRFQPNARDPRSFSEMQAQSVTRDYFGNLWVGTSRFLNLATANPRFVTHLGPDKGLVSPNASTATRVAPGKIVLGTTAGLSIYDCKLRTFRNVHLPLFNQNAYNDGILSIAPGDATSFWVSTWSTLCRLDLNTGAILEYVVLNINAGEDHPAALKFFEMGPAGRICRDGQGNLWLAARQRMVKLTRKPNNAVEFVVIEPPYRADGRHDDESVSFLPVGDRLLYVGTHDGLVRYDVVSGALQLLPVSFPGVDGPARVMELALSKNGTILATVKQKLFRIDPNHPEQPAVPLPMPLANFFPTGLIEDRSGIIWMSGEMGLVRYDPATNNCTLFDSKFHLDNNFFGTRHLDIAEDANGHLYFSGSAGVSVIRPEAIVAGGLPNVKMESLRVNGQIIPLEADIYRLPEIRLAHDQNNLLFGFSVFNSSIPALNRYAYRLEGVSDSWVELNHQSSLNLVNLAPGTYVLHLRGGNSDGLWAEAAAPLRIVIRSPWWSTWWAWLVYLLVVAVAGWRWYHVRMRRFVLEQNLAEESRERERLAALDTFKSRFFTNISHEFRTPLTVILGLAERWATTPGKWVESEVRHSLSLIQRSGENLLRLIVEIMDLARLENNALQLSYMQGDVLVYLHYISESLHSLAAVRHLSLRVESAEKTIVMDYDPERLLQIVHNLLSNAIKFTPTGGEVVLTARILPQNNGTSALQIEVRDTGAGIPEGQLTGIFDRFFQAENQHYSSTGGTGVGLSLTRELVRTMGGDITVRSALGQGTTFTVQLPITNQASRGNAAPVLSRSTATFPPESDLPVADESLPQLLLIEDNPDVMAYLVTCLQNSYRLELAYNGREGYEKALQLVPDLIVSDVMMPEMNGLEVCDRLKNDERSSHIPVVLLTAKADVDSRIAGLRRGADVYLSKPFHEEELRVVLRNLLEQRRKLQARFGAFAPPQMADKAPDAETPEASADLKIENAFLQKIWQHVEAALDDTEFDGPRLAKLMLLSEVQLYRKIKALTGKSTAVYIRSIRLQMAQGLLRTTSLTISEIAYRVGFEDPNYFSRTFSQEFGVAPSEMRK
jgi:signal transduction histidine kinase/DNA-binding response OmpR family regulator/ligand-binding sensor domain-containing protein